VGEQRSITCERCGTAVEVSVYAVNAKYCPACALEVRREADRDLKRRKRNKPVVTGICVVCEREFEIKKAGTSPKACTNCRAKYYEQNREKRKIDPKKRREYSVRHQFGLSLEELDGLTQRQGNKCAACGASAPRGKSLSVDHDHTCCDGNASCGKCVRGLLCQRCNTFLGFVDDDPEFIKRMIEYIDTGGSPHTPNRQRLAGEDIA